MNNQTSMTQLAEFSGRQFLPRRVEEEWAARDLAGFSCDEERWYSMWAYGRLSWDEYQIATAMNIADKPHLYRPSVFLRLPEEYKRYIEQRLTGKTAKDETSAKVVCSWLISHSELVVETLDKIKIIKHGKDKLKMIDDYIRIEKLDSLLERLDLHAKETEKAFVVLWAEAKRVVEMDGYAK